MKIVKAIVKAIIMLIVMAWIGFGYYIVGGVILDRLHLHMKHMMRDGHAHYDGGPKPSDCTDKDTSIVAKAMAQSIKSGWRWAMNK